MKTYYKNGDSATTTYRDLKGDYSLHKFEETAVVILYLYCSINTTVYCSSYTAVILH